MSKLILIAQSSNIEVYKTESKNTNVNIEDMSMKYKYVRRGEKEWARYSVTGDTFEEIKKDNLLNVLEKYRLTATLYR